MNSLEAGLRTMNSLPWTLPIMLLPASAVAVFGAVKHVHAFKVRVLVFELEPLPMVQLQLWVTLAVATLCGLLELLGGRASPVNQGWRYVLGVASAYFFLEGVVMDMLLANPAFLKLAPPRSGQMRTMAKTGMTRIILITLCISALHRDALDGVYAVAACASWGAMASFNAVLAVDPGAHGRLARHVGVPLRAFTALNLFVVHGLPCAVTTAWPPRAVTGWHGAVTGLLCLAWGFASTGGTFVLDEVYAPCRPAVWHALFAVFVATAAATPWALSAWLGSSVVASVEQAVF
jgi:hypothetical protein